MCKKVINKLRDHCYREAGLKEDFTYESLKESQWSDDFERLMRNRLIIGGLRYGLIKDAHKYNKIESIVKRIDLYIQDNNLEHLVDVANLCLIEFVNCRSYKQIILREKIKERNKTYVRKRKNK